MKIRFATAIFVGLLFSCSPKVIQPVATAPPSAEPVEANHEVRSTVPAGAMAVEEIAHGKKMYENNCANCHKLFSPTDFTQEQWAPILVRMQKKARLDDAEISSVRNYINSEAQ